MGSKRTRQKKVDSIAPGAPAPVPDDDLMDDLFSQLDSREQPVINQSTEQPAARSRLDPKGRFKARQVGARVPFHMAPPHSVLGQKGCCVRTIAYPSRSRSRSETGKGSERGGKRHQPNLPGVFPSDPRGMRRAGRCAHLTSSQVNPDGHCLFSAIADQLALLGILPASLANYAVVRQAASHYIFSHPDDFLPFLPPPAGADGLMTPALFESYCLAIRDTAEWGGEPEILALSRAYSVPIHVIQAGRPSVVVHDPHDPINVNGKRVIRISYHRRMYGLGEVRSQTVYPFTTLKCLVHSITILSDPEVLCLSSLRKCKEYSRQKNR